MSLHVTTISMMRLMIRLSSVAAISLALGVGPGFAQREEADSAEEVAPTERRNLRPGGSDSEIKAAQMIAEMELARRRHADVVARGAVENFITYEFTIEGEDDASIIKEAMVRALMNTASRLYFDDTILLGRDLLRPYLSVYGDRFVARRRVLDRHILAGGNLRLKVSVGVDKVRLYADLEQKHFLAEPKFRPFVAVLIEETEGGLPKAEGLGRSVLEEALRRNELKIESERMAGYGLNIDAAANPQILRESREEAQRWDIDVLVTGSVDVVAKESRVILYDQVFFTEGRLKLKVIRVDTGEVLREDKDHYSASGSTAEDAYKTLLENMINRTVEKLADGFLSDWANLMLDLSDYRLMISGVDDDALENISSMLKTLSPNLRLFVKSYYGNVAVLNIVYPDAKPGEVEDFLRQSRAPQLRIRYTDQRRMEIEVL